MVVHQIHVMILHPVFFISFVVDIRIFYFTNHDHSAPISFSIPSANGQTTENSKADLVV